MRKEHRNSSLSVLHAAQKKAARSNPNLDGNQVFVPDIQRVKPDIRKECFGKELGDVNQDKAKRRLKRAAGGAAKMRREQYY